MMIEFESNWIYFDAEPQQAVKLDAIWNAKRTKYKLPNTLGALRELHKAGYDVKDYGIEKAKEHKSLLNLKEGYHFKDYGLRPYQNDDVFFLQKPDHVGIFSQMRTGKTPTTLTLLEAEGRKKNLVVCPASLVLNWSNEVQRWTDKTPFPVSGTKKQRLKTYENFKEASEGYLIISKDTLRSDIDVIETL